MGTGQADGGALFSARLDAELLCQPLLPGRQC
jgi:hypothetical protein